MQAGSNATAAASSMLGRIELGGEDEHGSGVGHAFDLSEGRTLVVGQDSLEIINRLAELGCGRQWGP